MNGFQSSWWAKAYTIWHTKSSIAIRMDEEVVERKKRRTGDFSVLDVIFCLMDFFPFLFVLDFVSLFSYFCFLFWKDATGIMGEYDETRGEQNWGIWHKTPKDLIKKLKKNVYILIQHTKLLWWNKKYLHL